MDSMFDGQDERAFASAQGDVLELFGGQIYADRLENGLRGTHFGYRLRQ